MVTQSKEVVNSDDLVEYTKNNDVIAGLILISTKCSARRHTVIHIIVRKF